MLLILFACRDISCVHKSLAAFATVDGWWTRAVSRQLAVVLTAVVTIANGLFDAGRYSAGTKTV